MHISRLEWALSDVRTERLIDGKVFISPYTCNSQINATAPATIIAAVASGFAAPAAAVLSEVEARVVDQGLPDGAVVELTAPVVVGNADDAVCGVVVSAAPAV